ncbi:hypothetical protein G9A89_018142 [Geosiphon pyriformis]|nr:hypothetical protein G9A89_018142 [Geosiphon pyriformis]
MGTCTEVKKFMSLTISEADIRQNGHSAKWVHAQWLENTTFGDIKELETPCLQKLVDKTLTKKTAHTIRDRIDDILPQSSTSGDVKSKSIQSDDLSESFDEKSKKEDLKGSLGNATELEERNDDDQDEVEDNVSFMDKGAKLEFKKIYMEMH